MRYIWRPFPWCGESIYHLRATAAQSRVEITAPFTSIRSRRIEEPKADLLFAWDVVEAELLLIVGGIRVGQQPLVVGPRHITLVPIYVFPQDFTRLAGAVIAVELVCALAPDESAIGIAPSPVRRAMARQESQIAAVSGHGEHARWLASSRPAIEHEEPLAAGVPREMIDVVVVLRRLAGVRDAHEFGE